MEPTKRDLNMLRSMGLGHTNEKMARQMGLSVNSIKSYVTITFAKMGVSNRTEAVALAVAYGWLHFHLEPASKTSNRLGCTIIDPSVARAKWNYRQQWEGRASEIAAEVLSKGCPKSLSRGQDCGLLWTNERSLRRAANDVHDIDDAQQMLFDIREMK